MKVVAHHSEQELERLASREKRADLAKRLRAVLLAKQGFTAPEVATCTVLAAVRYKIGWRAITRRV